MPGSTSNDAEELRHPQHGKKPVYRGTGTDLQPDIPQTPQKSPVDLRLYLRHFKTI